MRGLPSMPTLKDCCQDDHQKRKPRKFEEPLSYIIATEGRAELTLWVLKHGTVHEWLWWTSRILESETDEEIPLALDIAALGYNEANAIHVAGIRLQEKLVKAFLKPKLSYV
jgi:hypothetical protein